VQVLRPAPPEPRHRPELFQQFRKPAPDVGRNVYGGEQSHRRDNFLVYKLILPESFYRRDTVTVARDLLGKFLVANGEALPIVEVEAYLGLEDKAAHASRGVTPRTQVIYGPPGRAYVYLIYGMHYCLNLIAEPDGTPGCVLIRGVQGVSGPGRCTKHFKIGARHNKLPVFHRDGLVQVHDRGVRPTTIDVTPRIGITKSAGLPLRFVAAGLRY